MLLKSISIRMVSSERDDLRKEMRSLPVLKVRSTDTDEPN